MKIFFRELYRGFVGKECLQLAANISFCALLSLIPMLMIGVAAAGYLLGGTEEVYSHLIRSVTHVLPQGKELILANLEEVMRNWHQLGLWGLGILLFISTLLFGAIERALNKIFVAAKGRNFFHSRLMAVGLILLFSILFFLPILASIMETSLARFGFTFPLSDFLHGAFYRPLFSFVAFLVVLKVVPTHPIRFRYVLAGGVVFVLGVSLTRRLFFLYLGYAFNQYNIIFGSLAALVLLILWIYYLSLVLLIAALVAKTLQMSHVKR